MAIRASYTAIEKPVAGLGLISPPPISVEFLNFSGTLVQLFASVREQKINLADVPMLPICEAYFRYLLDQIAPDLDESAAALAALAYLLERKAWLMLPLPEKEAEDEDVLSICESMIHEYFGAIDYLRQGFELRSQLFFRAPVQGPRPYELPYPIENLEVKSLVEALCTVLAEKPLAVVESVARAGRSLVLEMKSLLLRISSVWKRFDDLLTETASREDAVYTFMSVLELIRLGQVKCILKESEIFFSRA